MPTDLPFDEEPEYELTDADLEEAWLDNLEPGPAPEFDELLVDAAIEDAAWERLVGERAA
jgi:hypothetical protein